jgi:hypothetical protein
VYHSGHYRVALAVNSRNDLPPDPVVAERWTEKGPYSTWAQIQSPPQIPVLADGLFPHYPKPGEPASKRVDPKSPMIWETDLELPNINCPKCTLQVVQFMADHGYNVPGGYSYHHCAALEITADPQSRSTARWPVKQVVVVAAIAIRPVLGGELCRLGERTCLGRKCWNCWW